MPKERRDRSLSSDRSRASPFPCSSSRARRSSSKNHSEPAKDVKEWEEARSSSKQPSESLEDVKEWEEARCPVCMEHPHNAVLLLCSSHEKGCRPYMCDTSYRHSNCLDQFRKAFSQTPSAEATQNEALQSSTASGRVTSAVAPMDIQEQPGGELDPEDTSLFCEGESSTNLVCPLCRGKINGWVVVEAARRFMNAKSRSCSCETCDFSGTYTDLRKHARLVHPLVRPSEADPERQRDWRRLERQRDLGDVVSTIRSALGEEMGMGDDDFLPFGGRLLVFLFFSVQNGSSAGNSSWSGASRARGQPRSRRRTTLWGESYDTDNGSPTAEGDTSLDAFYPLEYPISSHVDRRCLV
uniref:Uncharacterized protein n=1 Tax=Nelumbo nucifera TaxID=4432 RepID=A0A822ZSM4_NELNU|nr:TPA_asm: hypothetical protein HUJ06_003078 [Nelumbo nucifera]